MRGWPGRSFFERHRRLLALCGLSLLLHLAAIEWIAHRAGSASHAAVPQSPISVRLQAPARTAPPAPAMAPAAAPRAMPPPAPPGAAPPALPGVAAPAPGSQPLPAAPEQDAPEAMPGHYRVRMPPSAQLTYALSRSVAGQPAHAAGVASLTWKTEGSAYTLQLDGVIGHLASEGVADDGGIRPLQASELRPGSAALLTQFDPQTGQIAFSASNRRYPMAMGSQDRASVLMQLAGIGLERPDQVKDTIDIYVGGADAAGVVRYQVMGQEELDTTLGTLATWHLVQLARAGETRLELWLAPAHQWLPVQLRATAADGTVSVQTVTRIDIEPAPRP